MTEPKLDLDKMDFTDIGAPPRKSKTSITQKKGLYLGIRINGKSLVETTPEELVDWLTLKMPNLSKPRAAAFRTIESKEVAVEKVINFYTDINMSIKQPNQGLKN